MYWEQCELSELTVETPAGITHNDLGTNSVQNSVKLESSQTLRSQEEDGFAQLEKAAENLVAQWTAEEDAVDKTAIFPSHHEDAYKWFYRDPQGRIQGPFTSPEMLEWFRMGYFSMALMVRRGCDERFAQLGELIKSWNRVPFSSGPNPPPLRAGPPLTIPLTIPMTTTLPQGGVHPLITQPTDQEQKLRLLQTQLLQHQLQQSVLQSHLITQLKQREDFNNLNPQQQQILVQQLLAQQLSRPTPAGGIVDAPIFWVHFHLFRCHS
ncbi:uncharacterized protein LOC143252777 [Tachypleus tridentatus]|uniref:uncharacterized protein LOC143252777 n=1 Tax=Tachypleus tridentatus TaxID=6853 RepID=UPI003FD0393D